ncbi:MAG: anthranilate synthase component I [Caldilineales bacterium]|nr:anthranilate synthase component I [Caldilineales bacterium]
MYQPTLDAVRQLSATGNLIPIYRILPADLETPVSVYLKLQQPELSSFLLESVEKGEQMGRYSFIGVDPPLSLSLRGHQVTVGGAAGVVLETFERDKPLDELSRILHSRQPIHLPDLPSFTGGAVGYWGYDIVRHYERLPETARDELGLPDAVFLLADNLVIFDHVKHRLIVLANARLDGDITAAYADAIARIEKIVAKLAQPLIPPRLPDVSNGNVWESNKTQAEYEQMVLDAKEYIAAGDIFQVVPSQRLSRRTKADPFAIYRALRMTNPSPYMFFLNLPGDLHLIGASPEMHVRLEDGRAQLHPIAGTRWRGATPAEDARLAEDLLADPKERAEHIMLVDLGRNDLGRVCNYGTVQVTTMMAVERYSHVMHIVSDVVGELHDGVDAFDLLAATFPAGTVSGAPKIRAMEIIEELEGVRRGVYAGAVGYIGYDGAMDTCIAIRTIVMQGDMCHVQAGGGVVADSEPTYEYNESHNKARALAVAVEVAEKGLL